MPGLGRKREMIREGQDWTQEGSGYTCGKKDKRYKKGGKIPGYMGGGGVMGMETSYKKKDRRP